MSLTSKEKIIKYFEFLDKNYCNFSQQTKENITNLLKKDLNFNKIYQELLESCKSPKSITTCDLCPFLYVPYECYIENCFIPELYDLYVDLTPIINFLKELGTIPEKQEIEDAVHGHPRFYELIEEIKKLHGAKNKDYVGDDLLSNLKSCSSFGISPFKGVLVRLSDKWSRICQLAKNYGEAAVKDERIKDTLMDLVIYSLLAIILFEEENK